MIYKISFMVLLISNSLLFPGARLPASAPKKLSDYRMKPHHQAAIANVTNIILNSIFAIASNNNNDCMQAVNQVLTSVGNIAQIAIERPSKRTIYTPSSENSLKNIFEEFFSHPDFLKVLQRKLEDDRYLFILKLKSVLREVSA
jgi:hypothetical protein